MLGLNYEGSRNVSYDYLNQYGTSFLDENGLLSFNIRNDAFLYGINSSDFIFRKVYAPLRAGAKVEETFDIGVDEPEYVTYETTLTYISDFQIKAGLFNNVSKVIITTSDSDLVETFYFKEGFGLLKHEYASRYTQYQTKILFELLSFQLK